jgi:predicted RNA-binding Zn-ribbon protein involved in translation (DUF1610 family)
MSEGEDVFDASCETKWIVEDYKSFIFCPNCGGKIQLNYNEK